MTAMQKSDEIISPSTETEEISGTIDNIVYHSDDTAYTVFHAKITGKKDKSTVVGSCPVIWAGETFTAKGKWINHKQHGIQFQADSIISIPPASAKGIEKFLASGMIKGIRKGMAARLVKHFGTDALRIIEKESQRLEEVDGIGEGRRKMIKDSWNEQKAVRDIMIFLQGHNIGTAQALRIFRQYGSDAVAMIRSDPYRLCREVWGIGFKTADKVALSLGVPPHSELRAQAGIVYALTTMAEEGHCFCEEYELVEFTATLLDIPQEIIKLALEHDIQQKSIVRVKEKVYLAELHAAESGVAFDLARLTKHTRNFPDIIIDKAIPWAEEKMKIGFAPMQAEALKMALQEKVSIITGGPGVGKTTIIKALVDVFKTRKLKVLLAAPTGRASKRMEEATHHDASTIHRLLKYKPHETDFEFHNDNKLEGDIFIVDEVSMVDISLMHSLTCALPDKACLILVGDIDQLPSVGPGNVLRDIIESGMIRATRLETIFRQASSSLIVQNAHRVNHGEFFDAPEENTDDLKDFYFFEAKEPEDVIKRMIDLLRHIPDKFGFDPMTDIQILTPMRKNQLGADNLNILLQDRLNPSGTFMTRFGRKYKVGDRIMQMRNNYDKEVYNGDIGLIMDIDEEAQIISIDYEGRIVAYDFAEIDELIHAYACSIHKSQGSEYPCVIILLSTQHFKLLQRNLLYTAITRGKKLVCIVGSRKAIYLAIRNNEIRQRRTSLKDMIITSCS